MTEAKIQEATTDDIKKIGEFIHDIDFAMMTTINEQGELHSRPMSTQKAEFDGNVYFFAFDDTPKVQDITRNPNVNLAYAAPDKQTYLSLRGEAFILKDQQKMEELWQPTLKVWFPQGLDTPGITLIRVEVKTAEYWDSPASAVAYAVAFVKALVTGKSPNMGDNKTVEISG